MNNSDRLLAVLEANAKDYPRHLERARHIGETIPGWSKGFHYYFFRSWLDAFPEAKSVLMLGVYLGRDCALLLDAAGEREIRFTGVDKFNAEPCDDWPKEKRQMTWQDAFNCEPPSIDKARANINAKPPHTVTLIQANDSIWLEGVQGAFDLIYLDTAHDKATVQRQIRQVHKLCHPHTIVAGDDYNNGESHWGVKEAVTESFKNHYHIADTIWFAGAEDYL